MIAGFFLRIRFCRKSQERRAGKLAASHKICTVVHRGSPVVNIQQARGCDEPRKLAYDRRFGGDCRECSRWDVPVSVDDSNSENPKFRGRFPRSRRLSGQKAFARVFGEKRSASDRHLVVYAAPNGADESRLGVTVGRRHGGAVKRNRIKRLIREAFRLEYAELPVGFDLVCVPRVGEIPRLPALRRSLLLISRRAAAMPSRSVAAAPPADATEARSDDAVHRRRRSRNDST